MKLILVYALAPIFLLAGAFSGSEALDLADKIIREHHLLTPKQIQCITLVERDDTTARIAEVGVYERHDEKNVAAIPRLPIACSISKSTDRPAPPNGTTIYRTWRCVQFQTITISGARLVEHDRVSHLANTQRQEQFPRS